MEGPFPGPVCHTGRVAMTEVRWSSGDRETVMGIGLGIVLFLVGLILALGVVDLPASIDDALATSTLGWILIAVGILAIVLGLVMNAQRSRTRHVVEERRTDPPL